LEFFSAVNGFTIGCLMDGAVLSPCCSQSDRCSGVCVGKDLWKR